MSNAQEPNARRSATRRWFTVPNSTAARFRFFLFQGYAVAMLAGITLWSIALAHRLGSGLAVEIATGAVVGAKSLHELRKPFVPVGEDVRPTIVHSAASLLALTIVPWIGAAGLLGADLSTRPDFYAQIAQIIPVLLLAVLLERRFSPAGRMTAPNDRWILRSGFVLLVVGPAVAEILALLAIASRVQWIEVGATVLAASSIPALLVLIAGPVLMALYEPA